MLPEQELVEALARIEALEAELKVHLENLNEADAKIDRLEALVQSFDAVDKARQAENDKLREALRWTIESIDITDWSRDGIEMLDSARQLYLDTREGGE